MRHRGATLGTRNTRAHGRKEIGPLPKGSKWAKRQKKTCGNKGKAGKQSKKEKIWAERYGQSLNNNVNVCEQESMPPGALTREMEVTKVKAIEVTYWERRWTVRLVDRGGAWEIFGLRPCPVLATEQEARCLLRLLGVPPEAMREPQGARFIFHS